MAITPLDLPIMPILEVFSACIWLRERRKAQHVELGVIPLGKCNTKPWAEITSHPSPRASSRGPGSRHGLRPARQRAAPQAICMGIFQGIFRKSVAASAICFLSSLEAQGRHGNLSVAHSYVRRTFRASLFTSARLHGSPDFLASSKREQTGQKKGE